MKWQAKSFTKEAQKAEAQREVQMKKIKTYMDKGDQASCQILAGEAIRYQKEAANLHRMSYDEYYEAQGSLQPEILTRGRPHIPIN